MSWLKCASTEDFGVYPICTKAGFQVPFTKEVGKRLDYKFGKSSEKVGIIGLKSRDSRAFSGKKFITMSC